MRAAVLLAVVLRVVVLFVVVAFFVVVSFVVVALVVVVRVVVVVVLVVVDDVTVGALVLDVVVEPLKVQVSLYLTPNPASNCAATDLFVMKFSMSVQKLSIEVSRTNPVCPKHVFSVIQADSKVDESVSAALVPAVFAAVIIALMVELILEQLIVAFTFGRGGSKGRATAGRGGNELGRSLLTLLSAREPTITTVGLGFSAFLCTTSGCFIL